MEDTIKYDIIYIIQISILTIFMHFTNNAAILYPNTIHDTFDQSEV